MIVPENLHDLQRAVMSSKQVLAVGNLTKSPLSDCPDATKISLRLLSGITQYDPREFTFSALAGTPLKDIVDALAQRNQYLPFDPLLVDDGATIGGTTAAGLSGPGRFRYGGLRDFLLCVHFISGQGKMIQGGSNVVKNAAGFDIPKFMIGSLGRYGVMTELTFKVFPRPVETCTLQVRCESNEQAIERISMAASSLWELDAIDYEPSARSLFLRIAGPGTYHRSVAQQMHQRWGDDVSTSASADTIWNPIGRLQRSPDFPIVIKIPTTSRQALELCEQPEGELWISAAANVVWCFLKNRDQVNSLSQRLRSRHMSGLVVKGDCLEACIGAWPSSALQTSLKAAFDPQHRFPALHPNPVTV
jgi:glycolate oxidase FAD binding subunit